MKVYEIVKEIGLGLYESPLQYFNTGLIFKNKIDAENRANELWIENTTPEERIADSAPGRWCDIHFRVHERELL